MGRCGIRAGCGGRGIGSSDGAYERGISSRSPIRTSPLENATDHGGENWRERPRPAQGERQSSPLWHPRIRNGSCHRGGRDGKRHGSIRRGRAQHLETARFGDRSLRVGCPGGNAFNHTRRLERGSRTVPGLFTIEGSSTRPKQPPIVPICDNVVAWLGTTGILAALRRRAIEGGSYRVTVSLTRTVLWLLSLGIFDTGYARATAGSSDEHAYIAPDLLTAG